MVGFQESDFTWEGWEAYLASKGIKMTSSTDRCHKTSGKVEHFKTLTSNFIKPRDKAHWIIQSKGVWTHLYKCSKCGGGVMACELDMPKFCGHCGARMEVK